MTKPISKKPTDTNLNVPTVTRAVKTDAGQRFYEISMNGNSAWVQSSRLIREEKAVIGELADQGIEFHIPQLVTQLKKAIQAYNEFDSASVATQPGWLGEKLYVYPDGSHASEANEDEVFAVFEANTDYRQQGDFSAWRKGLIPFVKAQPLLLFFLMFALLPIFLRKQKLPLLSPALEIVGGPQWGKSVSLHFMGSVHGGNPDADVGLARSANFTKHSFEQLRRMTNDSLLLLDETNIADKSVTESLSMLFQLTSTDDRARFDGTKRKEQVRNAVVLTGNRALEEHSNVAPDVLAAARTRMITYRMKGPLFVSPPEGYTSNQDACIALKAHCNQHYGTASRKFVRVAINKSQGPNVLAEKIHSLREDFKGRVEDAGAAEGRLLDVFALVYATGQLALDWKVFSKFWPDPMETTLDVFSSLYGEQGAVTLSHKNSPAMNKLVDIIVAKKTRIIEVSDERSGPKGSSGRKALGYFKMRAGGAIWVFLNPLYVKRIGLNTRLQKSLRDEGILIGEGGSSSKLQSKAPAYVPLDGRVYKFELTKADFPKGTFSK